MIIKLRFFQILIFFLILNSWKPLAAQLRLNLETGIVGTGYNDVRIPGDQGTFFSLKDDLKTSSKLFYRLKAAYTINERHILSVLYAPLITRSIGSVKADLTFAGVVYPVNTELSASYKFNSYRLTYRYEFLQKPNLIFGIGFTAKIRDARIALESSGLHSEKNDLGFVPIINLGLRVKINERFGTLVEGDALGARLGRAEDFLFAVSCKISDKLNINAGYRILEGGADTAEVYTFALFHYASLGVTYTFNGRDKK